MASILILFLAVILQVALASHLKIFNVSPNFVLIVLLLSITYQEKNKSFFLDGDKAEFLKGCFTILPYSLTAGLILDVFSGLPFGTIAFSLSLSVLLIYIFFHSALNNFNLFYAFVLAFLATFFYYIGLWLFIRAQISSFPIIIILKEALFNAFLTFIFYALERSRKIFY